MTKGVGKLYFVSGTFSGAGAVKVIDADGSNEITLAEGKDVIEPDGIEVDLHGLIPLCQDFSRIFTHRACALSPNPI